MDRFKDPDLLLKHVNRHVHHQNYMALVGVLEQLREQSAERPILRPAYRLVRRAMYELMVSGRVI